MSSGFLIVGEALVDVVTRPDGTTTEHPGGSPANVALGLARLGRPTWLFTRIGSDERGRLVREHLEGSGVHLVEGSVTDGRTSTATATLAPDGSASYEFDLDWSLDGLELPQEPLVVHTGSIAATLQPGAASVARIVHEHRRRATTSYDPNLRPALMGSPDAVRATVEELVAASDVVKLSDEDARWFDPGTEPEALAARWLATGPAVVVVTRGGGGATGLCAAGRVQVAAPKVEVADTVGAGDSFTAAMLDALWTARLLGAASRPGLRAISTTVLEEVLRHAVLAAAVTVSRPGADPPRRSELH